MIGRYYLKHAISHSVDNNYRAKKARGRYKNTYENSNKEPNFSLPADSILVKILIVLGWATIAFFMILAFMACTSCCAILF